MPPDARRSRVVAWGLALLLLAIGAAGGMAVDRLLLGRGERAPERGPPRPEEILQRLRDDLELSEAQASAIGGILEERQRALSLLFSRVDPEAEGIRKEAAGRIRALLEPAQQARFDVRMQELERRRAELRRRFQASR
jgi:hypothetical protein